MTGSECGRPALLRLCKDGRRHVNNCLAKHVKTFASAPVPLVSTVDRAVGEMQYPSGASCLTLGLEPNTFTFNAAMAAYSQGSLWQRSLDLFEEACLRGVKIDTISLNTCLSARKGTRLNTSWKSALSFLMPCQRATLQLDVFTCTAFFSLCKGRWWLARTFLEAQRQEAIPIAGNLQLRNAYMSAALKDDWDLALWLLQEPNMPQDAVTLKAVSGPFSRSTAWEPCMALMQNLKLQGQRSAPPTFLLSSLARAQLWQRAMTAMAMASRGPQRFQGSAAITAAVSACERANQWQVALVIPMNLMLNQGWSGSSIWPCFLSVNLQSCWKNGERERGRYGKREYVYNTLSLYGLRIYIYIYNINLYRHTYRHTFNMVLLCESGKHAQSLLQYRSASGLDFVQHPLECLPLLRVLGSDTVTAASTAWRGERDELGQFATRCRHLQRGTWGLGPWKSVDAGLRDSPGCAPGLKGEICKIVLLRALLSTFYQVASQSSQRCWPFKDWCQVSLEGFNRLAFAVSVHGPMSHSPWACWDTSED